MEYNYLFIDKNLTIRQAIKKLDETAKKILLVVEGTKLIGIITDGDIRRWILKNGDLNEPVELIMNKKPICLTEDEQGKAERTMKKYFIEAIPIVNEDKEVINMLFWNELSTKMLRDFNSITVPVVIMAGGKGARLYPYTKVLPKPLIPLGETPIVEKIINRFHDYGCKDFYLTLLYKKNMIKAYFNDLDKKYNVFYVEEEKPLGTCGSLFMLKNTLKDTFFVSNCDILINSNYYDMMKYHKKNNNKITMITSLKNYKIPYGVIELSTDSSICKIHEKPEYNFLVNTGMYIVEPEVLSLIPENNHYDFTDLVEDCMKNNFKVGTFPVSENSWVDIGQISELESFIEREGI